MDYNKAHRHFGCIEFEVVDASWFEMCEAFAHAADNDLERHVQIEQYVHFTLISQLFVQLYSLRHTSRESCKIRLTQEWMPDVLTYSKK